MKIQHQVFLTAALASASWGLALYNLLTGQLFFGCGWLVAACLNTFVWLGNLFYVRRLADRNVVHLDLKE